MNKKNLLITGGAGFIGSNFVNYWADMYSEDKKVAVKGSFTLVALDDERKPISIN